MNILTLFISLRCTNACAHCVFGCRPDRGDHMSWDVFTRSLDIAKESQIPILNFFGGEPLVNPHFFMMLQKALENGFDVIIATNCRPLAKEDCLTEFLDITKQYKDRCRIITSRDRFHLQFFDPTEIVEILRNQNYKVVVNSWSDYSILLSEKNANNIELQTLNTSFSCCNYSWTDYIGVLPDGGWQICPPYLKGFGNIFCDSFEEITEFRRGLILPYQKGCTECLKLFNTIHEEFEAKRIANHHII